MTLGAVDPPPFPTRNILGVEISVARQREAIEFLLARLAARLPTQVAFANANLLTELSGRPGGARLLDGFLVLNDGIAVDLASLALYRLWFPENLNGTDLIRRCSQPRLGERGCRSMAPSPEVVAKTAALLEERYGCAVCGAIDGFTVAAPEAVARHLSAGAPTCPRQPSAGGVDRYSRAHDRRAADDRGWGALRFLAGAVPRAPVRCGGCGSNGCIAGRRSPGACARRYTIGMAPFLSLCCGRRGGRECTRRPARLLP
jgi:beta-1,4-glucosyltransferase